MLIDNAVFLDLGELGGREVGEGNEDEDDDDSGVDDDGIDGTPTPFVGSTGVELMDNTPILLLCTDLDFVEKAQHLDVVVVDGKSLNASKQINVNLRTLKRSFVCLVVDVDGIVCSLKLTKILELV